MSWQRGRGWPLEAAKYLAVVSLSGMFAVTLMPVLQPWTRSGLIMGDWGLALAALLAWTRRSLEIHSLGDVWGSQNIHHGWGFSLPWGFCQVSRRSAHLPSLTAIWVELQEEHYKGRKGFFAVVGGRSRWQRAILDDEYGNEKSARARGLWLAEQLGASFAELPPEEH